MSGSEARSSVSTTSKVVVPMALFSGRKICLCLSLHFDESLGIDVVWSINLVQNRSSVVYILEIANFAD